MVRLLHNTFENSTVVTNGIFWKV